MAWYINADNLRLDTSVASLVFKLPEAAFLGLANVGMSRDSRRSFRAEKLSLVKNISPRTSKSSGASSGNFNGSERMVRTLAMTSSPCCPSPRVNARVSTRFSYHRAMATPSYFNSQSHNRLSPCSARSMKASNSSLLYVLLRESMRRR